MKKLQRLFLSCLISLVVAGVLASIVLAGTTYVSETSSNFVWSMGPAVSTETCGSCADGSAKYREQNSSNPTVYYWSGSGNIDQWYVYVPGVGKAGVSYSIRSGTETYYTILDQSKNQNQYRFIGWFEYDNSGGRAILGNQCVSGYYCDGRRVYWDKAYYTTR